MFDTALSLLILIVVALEYVETRRMRKIMEKERRQTKAKVIRLRKVA